VKEKASISEKIENCEYYLFQAEKFAYDHLYDDSNTAWNKASEIAISLIKNYGPEFFTEEEYKFLKTIINHITED
jgi:hypothetical protein